MIQSRHDNRWLESPELIRLSGRGADRSLAPDRTFWLDEGLPSHISPESVRYLSLYESYPPSFLKTVPPYLKEFVNLEGLYLPSYTLEAAKPGDIPTDNLRYLQVFHENVTLPKSLYFPRLEALGNSWGECHFSADNLPVLRDLTTDTDLDCRGQVLKAVQSLPSLRVLHLFKVRSEETFPKLAHLGLEHLGTSPVRGFRSIHGIEQLATLKTLRLTDYRRMDSIEPLAKLPLLEEVFFHDCKELPSLVPLVAAPSLKSLRFIGCGPLP